MSSPNASTTTSFFTGLAFVFLLGDPSSPSSSSSSRPATLSSPTALDFLPRFLPVPPLVVGVGAPALEPPPDFFGVSLAALTACEV
ncbi:hypothetical protein Tdes44962_MAKER03928 [Teratosphaeria destructans]|uniref:Secreted protein n=1 Tax=Teratosphaeria destructans TaxID=418781 RepID=A0A9W7SNU6_9PEZI|nr:hypothetical protein Tdes44962_MAKER03928 [Teratosphaeria destructans]